MDVFIRLDSWLAFLDASTTIDKGRVKIFPNPVEAGADIFIAIEKDLQVEELSLYDTAGRLIVRKAIAGFSDMLTLKSPDQSGLFLMKIKMKETVFYTKLLVVGD